MRPIVTAVREILITLVQIAFGLLTIGGVLAFIFWLASLGQKG